MAKSPRSSASDCGGRDSDNSGTPDPLTEYTQALGDEGCERSVNSYGTGVARVFDVEFPPNGPLGITFEWAVDPAARWYGDGGTPVASPRTPPLGASTLPPISPSPTSKPTGHAAPPLELPVGPALLPHALRIQSFPALQPLESPRSVAPGAGTTSAGGGDSEISIDGETQPTAVTAVAIFQTFSAKGPRASDESRMYA